MKFPLLATAILLAAAPYGVLSAESPQVTGVSPNTGKPGSELNIQGVSLGKDRVHEVYLTDHKFDMRVKVLKQSDNAITFRIPPFAKPGRLQLMVLVEVPGKPPKLLEQPAYVVVEDDKPELSSLK
ncbi:MAG: IPT/TIG domain-containing protein [Bryobacteraceae bacterium]